MAGSRSGTRRLRWPRGRKGAWATGAAAAVLLLLACCAWLGVRAFLAQKEIGEAQRLAKVVQTQVVAGQGSEAQESARQFAAHVDAGRSYVGDPIWSLAGHVPFVGSNFSTVSRLADILGTVTHQAVLPLADVAGTISPATLKPSHGAVDLKPVSAARPAIVQADKALQDASTQLAALTPGAGTLPPVRDGLERFRAVVGEAAQQVSAADTATSVLPAMLGSESPRTYLVIFQNNAELRATGGIPGAAAEVRVDHGKITLGRQAAGKNIGPFEEPVLPLTDQTQGLYEPITGQYFQDVNLTPQFPLSARLATEMWRRQFGQKVDGVLSLDPVALGYLLKATGPVKLPGGETMDSGNAVKLLLSEAYADYRVVQQKDEFFATAAATVFQKVSAGGFQPKAMLDALGHAASERRLLAWSPKKQEQDAIAAADLSGWPPASSSSKDSFGVYLNDATGAKMDYYLREAYRVGGAMCRQDGRPTWQVEVTLTSVAPPDAATALPRYVTGGGVFGVPAGEVKTQVNVYAPQSAVFLGAWKDSKSFNVHRDADAGYPVAQTYVSLAPGASTTLRFQFLGDEHSETTPGLISTPTVNKGAFSQAALSCKDVAR
ncbi:hypothetical protein J2W21_001982 [Sinomonas atrocyanea]|uniref:DUF4012 domain-containing protein n=1 Tax=Sinomonas atrocyanea TaxID=37927 RepID=UPI00278234C8|nr:DUF4012 domain-containing protein [Sinomonas atrocyanea]MDP9884469.1 hypothetical protein [Sinomonas atrocyanea]